MPYGIVFLRVRTSGHFAGMIVARSAVCASVDATLGRARVLTSRYSLTHQPG